MDFDVTIAVATFGDQSWIDLAQRAIATAMPQARCVYAHRGTLAEARNAALAMVETEWVVHLDADDELEPGYINALADGTADLRAPAVRYVGWGIPREPYIPRVASCSHPEPCVGDCLPGGNWLVVGTAARAELLRSVGGWEEWPVYEDWALWLRCQQAGATVEAIPSAVYRAHVRPDSRNRAPSIDERNRVHHQIVEAIMPEAVA